MAITVHHIMARDPRTLPSDMNALDAAGMMAKYDIGAIPIVSNEGRLEGLVTDRDLVLRVLADRQDPSAVTLGSIATARDLVTVAPGTAIPDALKLMSDRRVRRLLVMEGDELVGVVSMGDLANASASKRVVGETEADITESPSTTEVADDGPIPGTPARVEGSRDAG
jgi:CBS domain-containing protein